MSLANENVAHPVHSIQLGHVDVREIHDKDFVDNFVRARAMRLNIDLTVYEIDICDVTGCVTAKVKLPRAQVTALNPDVDTK